MSNHERANADSLAQSHADLDKLRRQRFRAGVAAPFAIALIAALAYVGTALALPAPVQVAALSDAALTLLLLCPLTILLFPAAVLTLALVALMNRWQKGSLSPLRRLEGWMAALEQNADRWLGSIDRRVLRWAVAFAPIRQLLRSFDTLSEVKREGRETRTNDDGS